jgi:hypothetical protein
VLSGTVAGAISGLLVAVLDSIIAETVGACGGYGGFEVAALVCFVSGGYGAIYGAAIGAALVSLAAIAIPRAVERSSWREICAFLLAGGTLGSIASWLIAGGVKSCDHWGPFIARNVHIGVVDFFYVGPHSLVVAAAAILLFGGLITRLGKSDRAAAHGSER